MRFPQKIFFFILGLFCSFSASAELKIDVAGAMSEPIPMAIPYFAGDSDLGEKITDIIVSDLESSGLFRLINRDAYIQQISNINTRPSFQDWQAIKAHALLVGEVESSPVGAIKVSYRLWDIFNQNQMEAQVLSTENDSERKIDSIKINDSRSIIYMLDASCSACIQNYINFLFYYLYLPRKLMLFFYICYNKSQS